MRVVSRGSLALAALLASTAASADLVPSDISACRHKKAGDACEVFGGATGTCIEANLDHVPLKWRAHLRCEIAPAPAPSATPSAMPSVAPPASAPSSPEAPSAAHAPSAAAPEAPKGQPSGGCATAGGAAPEGGGLVALLVLAVVLRLAKPRRIVRVGLDGVPWGRVSSHSRASSWPSRRARS